MPSIKFLSRRVVLQFIFDTRLYIVGGYSYFGCPLSLHKEIDMSKFWEDGIENNEEVTDYDYPETIEPEVTMPDTEELLEFWEKDMKPTEWVKRESETTVSLEEEEDIESETTENYPKFLTQFKKYVLSEIHGNKLYLLDINSPIIAYEEQDGWLKINPEKDEWITNKYLTPQ